MATLTTTTSLPPPRNIAIIGAGLSSLALTLLLSGTTHPPRITILELRPRHATDGGYLALAPNALHVLDHLGVYDKLLPQGFAYEDINFLSARTLGKIGVVRNGDRGKYGYPALRISRGVVRGELLAEVERLCARKAKGGEGGGDEVVLRFESKVVKVEEREEEGGKVLVGLVSGEEMKFDAVIGADGIHSRVRSLIAPDLQPTYSGMIGVGGGRLKRADIKPEGLHLPAMFLGRTNAFMMMPTVADGSEVTCFATMEHEERDRDGWAKLSEDKQELKKIMVDHHCGHGTEWPKVVEDACRDGDANSLTLWPHYLAPMLESWTTPSQRIILMGDAAHAMPPTGGQGAAMAFEDAAALAMVFEKSASLDTFKRGITQWQTTRRARVAKVKDLTAKSGDMRRGTPSVLQQIIKEWIMWLYFTIMGSEGVTGAIYSHKEECPGRPAGKA